MRQFVSVALVLLFHSACIGAVIHVPGDSATIQAGIDGAQNGDTVLAADGMYTGEGNWDINLGGKGIVVKSENGSEYTTVDGDTHNGFIISDNAGSMAVLEGFTVRNCARGLRANSASISVLDCKFADCYLYNSSVITGAGMRCWGSTVLIDNCEFSNNEAFGLWNSYGGAIYALECSIEIRNTVFSQNMACNGGAVVTSTCDLIVESCIFADNETIENCGSEASEICGGLYVSGAQPVQITGCLFVRNNSGLGGAALHSCIDSLLAIENSTFSNNRSISTVLQCGDFTLENCIFAFNTGMGAYATPAPIDVSCCDIYGNTEGNWTGGFEGFEGINGNFSADPLFCDIAGTDYHLKECSPCTPENSDCGVQIGAFGEGCDYLCGDADASGAIDIDDAIRVYYYIFHLLPAPEPLESGDVDCSGFIDMDDVVYLVNYIFAGGPAPCQPDGDN